MVSVNYNTVSKKYDDGFVAVNGLDLEVKDGEFLVLLGPSGCGKSTTLRMLAGLEEVTNGEIQIDGVTINHLPPGARGLGMVFQSYALFPHMTVMQNVSYGLAMSQMPKLEAKEKAMEGLELVGLAGFGERLPSELSGGQQQRCLL